MTFRDVLVQLGFLMVGTGTIVAVIALLSPAERDTAPDDEDEEEDDEEPD